MRTEPFDLGPDLSLLIHWSTRMGLAMRKRYWAVMFNRPEAADRLREEYTQWQETIDAAYEKVQRFHTLIGGYPVEGDELHLPGGKPGTYYPGLRITKRTAYSSVGSAAMQLIYEVEAEKIMLEELEEYQEGDLVEDED